MNRHYTKLDFHGISLMVVSLEVLSALSLLFGGVGALYMMFTQEGTVIHFILIAFGGIVGAFVFYAIAEFLQLLMKIEVNTRKTEKMMADEHKIAEKRRLR
jgi:hypothetical protein